MNTANTIQEKEEKDEEVKLRKKSSVQVSTKRLELMKKTN